MACHLPQLFPDSFSCSCNPKALIARATGRAGFFTSRPVARAAGTGRSPDDLAFCQTHFRPPSVLNRYRISTLRSPVHDRRLFSCPAFTPKWTSRMPDSPWRRVPAFFRSRRVATYLNNPQLFERVHPVAFPQRRRHLHLQAHS